MATIQSTIELYDRFSAPMKRIVQVVSSSLPVLDSMQESLNKTSNTAALDDVSNAMQSVISTAHQLDNTIGQINGAVSIDTAALDDVQRANSMLQDLSAAQSSIAQAAANSAILSPQAQQDVEAVESRIRDLQSFVEQIEQNPLVVGSENANAGLEQLRTKLAQTLELQEELNAAMQSGDVSKVNIAYLQLSQNISEAEKTAHNAFKDIPVTWQVNNLEVFTTTGTERFKQEVQSANAMLNTLRQTQNSIATTAAGISILPANAATDITALGARLQAVQQRMQQIESNPLNMGTDAANNTLEQLRGNLNDAVQVQAELNGALQNMDIQSANAAYRRLSQIVANTEQNIRDNVDEQGAFNQKLQEGTTAAGGLWDKIKGFVGAYAGIQAIGKVVNISDAFSNVQARLGNISFEGDTTGVDGMVQMVYQAAQSARGSFTDMADVVARFGNNAKDAFSSSAEVVRFAELVQKQMTISGTSAQEASNAMLQLSQALGSGALRGDELNSIFEQSPALIQRIADYMGVSIGQIRELASEGQLTADTVKSAIMGAGEDIDAQFESMPTTWAQVWSSFQNSAMMAFQPVLSKITELASSNAVQTFVSNARGALTNLANVANTALDAVASIADFFTNNWSLIEPIVASVTTAVVAYNAAVSVANGVTLLSTAHQTAHTLALAAHAVMTGTATDATIAAAAAQTGLNATLLACPLTWIVAAVIAVIAAIYLAVAAFNKLAGTSVSATGIIMGAISTAGAFVWNLFVSLYNNCINIITMFYNQFVGVIEWVLNAANGGFNSFGSAVANLIGQVISWFLSLGQVVTTIIDAIFGTDWTAGLENLKGSVISWGKVENSITLDRMDPEGAYLNRINYGDAFNAGRSLGEGLENKLSSAFGGMGAEQATDNYTSLLDSIANNTANAAASTADTASNTSTLSDTTEELAYMRDLAEQEVINRYTTAEITINQSNSNTVNSGMDLDGVTSALTDGIFEAIATATEGVYA